MNMPKFVQNKNKLMHGRSCKGDKLATKKKKKKSSLFGLRGEGGRVYGSKIELVEIVISKKACRDYTLMPCLF